MSECKNVPQNVKDLLAPIEEHTVEHLRNRLQRIEYIPCEFKHEDLSAKGGATKLAKYNYVENCANRWKNAGCGHMGIKALHQARKDMDNMDLMADSDNLNNAVAPIEFTLLLVLAIGNHNNEASALIDKLMEESSKATDSDQSAAYHYDERAKGNVTPDEVESTSNRMLQRQGDTAKTVMAIRDRALALLESDMAKLATPGFERQPSGALNSRIGDVRKANVTTSAMKKEVEAMLR